MQYEQLIKFQEYSKKIIADKKQPLSVRKLNKIMLEKNRKLILIVKKEIKQLKYYI